jgi:pimeloyl-ACP methyl ester carboxylesterase
MSQLSPKPYRIEFSDEMLRDLRERLSRTRWPEVPPQEPWATGTSIAYMRDLVDYWRDRFDWRAQQTLLNRFQQFKVPVGGIDLHFIHEQGKGPNPMPLLLSHGWPGSIVEFQKIIPMLTDPKRFGGDASDAFTVVAPSLPGYTLSFTPGQPRFGCVEIAEVFASLMTDVLGYSRFAAQGGDWGGQITSRLGYAFADRVIGIHVTLLVRRDPPQLEAPAPEEQIFLNELNHYLKEETGYQWIQGTKPTTLSFGLTDSPVGLAAWIVEKFQSWTQNRGAIEDAVSRDDLLSNIMLYWATGAIGSSFWPYYARMHSPGLIPDGERIRVPTGYAEFPKDFLHLPRSWAERTYGNIQRWTKMEKGGHFAALEQPELLAREIREFFRPLR